METGDEHAHDKRSEGTSPVPGLQVVRSSTGLSTLKAAPHQVAGHLFERGKAGSLIDDVGHFYKPLQPGPRGEREENFYKYVSSKRRADQLAIQDSEDKNGIHGHSWVVQLKRILEEGASFSETVKDSLVALGYDLNGVGLHGGSNASSYLSREDIAVSRIQAQHCLDENDGNSSGNMGAGNVQYRPIQRFPTFSRGASELYEAKLAAACPMNVLQNDEFGLVDESERWLSGDEIIWSDDEGELGFPTAVDTLDLRELPFTLRNAPLLKAIPKFYGVVFCPDGSMLMELEDVARMYDRPAVMDVKIGMRTWYEDAAPEYIDKCKEKDSQTTQSTLGFKICGMQVYRNSLHGFWRASKQWCKTLTEASVDNALESFVHNESGLRPIDIYGGKDGVIRQLEQIEEWVQYQTEFRFYSSSILILYEGLSSGLSVDGCANYKPNVTVRLVDFAHTFVHIYKDNDTRTGDRHERDDNFLKGLRGFRRRLVSICNRC